MRKLVEYSDPVIRPVMNMQSDNYSFVYSLDYNIDKPNSWNIKPVIEFAIGSYKRFNRKVLTFQVEGYANNSINTIPNVKDPNNGFYFDHNRQVIGISNQYSYQKNKYWISGTDQRG